MVFAVIEFIGLFLGRGHLVRFWLLRDDHVLDFVVSSLRNNFFMNQVELGAIGTSINDFLGIGIPNARQFFKLILSCGINVELGRGVCGCGRSADGRQE